MANSHGPVISNATASKMPKVSVYSDIENSLIKLSHILYLDAHILDICATLEDPLQAGHLHMVFSDQLSFHKLLSHILTLDLDTSQYPAFHDLINNVENSYAIFVCDTEEKKDKN